MLLFADFWNDLRRFRRAGLSASLVRLLFFRSELAIWVVIVGALGIYLVHRGDLVSLAAAPVLIVPLSYILFVSFLVEFLTPLYFGSLAVGRLNSIEKGGRTAYLTLTFDLVPSGEVRSFASIGRPGPIKTIAGQEYLLALHPTNKTIALPMMDDNPRFLSYVLSFADNERAQEIADRLHELRGFDPTFSV
jgi:hypothetical protein